MAHTSQDQSTDEQRQLIHRVLKKNVNILPGFDKTTGYSGRWSDLKARLDSSTIYKIESQFKKVIVEY